MSEVATEFKEGVLNHDNTRDINWFLPTASHYRLRCKKPIFNRKRRQTNPLRKNQDPKRCKHLVVKYKTNLNLQQSRETVGRYVNRHVAQKRFLKRKSDTGPFLVAVVASSQVTCGRRLVGQSRHASKFSTSRQADRNSWLARAVMHLCPQKIEVCTPSLS